MNDLLDETFSSNSRYVMIRVVLLVALLVAPVASAWASQDGYPALTRETLVGTREGVFGIGTIPVVFHIVIAPRNEDSYLAEVYPEHLQGRVYRLETCTITDAKVYLRFIALPGANGSEWWIEGKGFGDEKRAWINGRIGTAFNDRNSSQSFFYLAKGTWVRSFGDASRRGEENIAEARAAKK
jgi:hypothetical protein